MEDIIHILMEERIAFSVWFPTDKSIGLLIEGTVGGDILMKLGRVCEEEVLSIGSDKQGVRIMNFNG